VAAAPSKKNIVAAKLADAVQRRRSVAVGANAASDKACRSQIVTAAADVADEVIPLVPGGSPGIVGWEGLSVLSGSGDK